VTDRVPTASRDWRSRSLAELLAGHGLAGVAEREFATDGWSGARFSSLERPGRPTERYVIKRTSPTIDWIAAATDDGTIREAWLANALGSSGSGGAAGGPTAYLGAAADGDHAAILMPDLSAELVAWERPDRDVVTDLGTLERVLGGLADLHVQPWPRIVDGAGFRPLDDPPFPWCPLAERLTLTARPTCRRHIARGIPAGVESARKLLAGWDAFDRRAPADARQLVAMLSADPAPLVAALDRLPPAGLHGDVKLANIALSNDRSLMRLIDWQMTIRAPVAVELGWFLVTNSAALPERPGPSLERYRQSLAGAVARRPVPPVEEPLDVVGDWEAQVDLAWIVGLLLRGWRKGLDAEAGATLGSGASGADDLGEWSTRAVAAAARRL
jgi:hypothetical protein